MLLIKNGIIVNPKTDQNERMDVLIDNDQIIAMGQNFSVSQTDQVIDAMGYCVVPGFIDLHVHLREPGFEAKETIYSGTRACAKGGYTTVVCMPNTNPALDSVETLSRLVEIIEKDAVISVYPTGAITKGIEGLDCTDHEALFKAGVIALTDDGRTTMNEDFMRDAFRNSRKWNRPIMTHSEDHDITVNYKDSIFPTEAESNIVVRDIELCKKENGILHVSHVSTADAINAIRVAKSNGFEVTCEAAPHHFALSDAVVDLKSTYSKVNPPIRSEMDRKILVDAIKEGVIDVIATDHAPHEKESKERPYAEASFGISGIETAFCVSYKALVASEAITLKQLVKMLTVNPAKIARMDHIGSIEPGYFADIAIIDLNADVVIDSESFVSKGKNTPFNGYQGKGEIIMTIKHGKIVYQKNN